MGYTKISEEVLEHTDGTELCHAQCDQDADHHDRRQCPRVTIPEHLLQPRICAPKRYHQLLTVASIALFCGLSASADGVVINSTSDRYERGMIVASGEQIELEDGHQITVLDESGEITSIEASSIYAFGDARLTNASASTPSAIDAAIWNSRRAEIGGMRAQDYEACLEKAALDPALSVDHCQPPAEHVEPAPNLELGLSGYVHTRYPGDKVQLKMTANFEADVSCELAPTDRPADTHALNIGPNGAEMLRLISGTAKLTSRRGGSGITAPQKTGTYQITCTAIAPRTLEAFTHALTDELTFQERSLLLTQFANIRRSPSATASTEFEVKAR